MMRYYCLLLLFANLLCHAQDTPGAVDEVNSTTLGTQPKATIDQYRIITLERDTTYLDTSLTIQKEYRFNYLRKDIFGLLPFSNEGQTYNTLQYSLNNYSPFPEFGYRAKHFNYIEARDMRYYSVATPLTELYFKTVMEQGQNVDAFATLNTSPRFNFSIAYKGLRSLGKYINQLTSAGNFRFTTSYNTLNTRYYVNAHFTAQDMLNGENGGITNIEDFESENEDYKNRARLNVFFNDAKTMLKGKRAFLDHNFRINSTPGNNNLYIVHQINFEYKYFEFNQATLLTTLDEETPPIQRLGPAYVTGFINDQVRYNRLYNKLGAVYENSLLGKFTFFVEDFQYNYFYDRLIVTTGVPGIGKLHDQINTVGGQYEYRKNKWRGKFLFANSISDQPLTNLDANMHYQLNEKNSIALRYRNISKVPDHLFTLHQSSYVGYNWYHSFDNEKINSIDIDANTQWFTASAQISTFKDHLYFSNDAVEPYQTVTPKQYNESINYVSVKVGREFRFRKFALDNTILYQQTDQEQDIINVPQIVTRNTLYYTDYLFKKALYLQTGVTVNYFTKYYANDYNPVIAEFFVQQQKEIGNFPMVDFFVNMRIKQTRIFFKAEHFNSAITGNNFYSAPNYPYRDFVIRFGLVWNFFQ